MTGSYTCFAPFTRGKTTNKKYKIMKTKSFLAVLLSIVLLFSLLPHAFAMENYEALLAEYQKNVEAVQAEATRQLEDYNRSISEAFSVVEELQKQGHNNPLECEHLHQKTDSEVLLASTCTTPGSHLVVTSCEDCTLVLSREIVEDPAAHDYIGEETVSATETEEGEMTYTCSLCGDSYTEAIPKLERNVTAGGVTITEDESTIGTADAAVGALRKSLRVPLLTSGSDKQNIDLQIEVPDKAYGEDVECIVYASVDGDYVLTIDGVRQTTITVRDNLANYNAGKLDAGTYHATVSFSGNDDYNPASAEDTFTVSSTGTPFSITASTSESFYGETVTITHTLPDDATGVIEYFLQDGTFLGMLDVSEILNLPMLDAWTWIVIAKYSGDNHFTSATDTILITILPAKLTITGVTASDKVYDGTNTATIDTSSATMSGFVSGGGRDPDCYFSQITFTGTYEDANVGSGKQVTVTATLPKGRHYVVDTINTPTASITKRTLTITANDQEYIYNGQTQGEGDTVYEDPAEIAEKVKVNGLQGSDALTSVVLDGQGQEIGEYELVPSNATVGNATGNYNIKYVKGKLTIKSKTISIIDAVVTVSGEYTYNGSERKPTPTVTLNGTTLIEGTDYEVTAYSNNLNAGTATVTVTGMGDYSGTATGTFTINKAPLTITAKDQEYVYNSQTQGEGDTAYEDPAQIAEKVTVTGLQGSDALTSVVLDGQGTEVGEYELVPSNATVGEATGNYEITYIKGKLTIIDTVATPTFSPAAGEYAAAQTVTISCATDGAAIYYTTDSSEPSASSTPYTATVSVSTTTTIKAIAVKDGMKDSAVATAEYTITLPPATFAVTVVNGTTKDSPAEEGATVTVTADSPADGKLFDKWTSEDGVTFADATVSTTTFTMPAKPVTVTANFKPQKFTIRFVNWDGTELQSSEWEYGATPKYDGTPIRPDEGDFTYTFEKWTPEIVAVTQAATYTASYKETDRGHKWSVSGDPVWSADHSKVTVSLVCERDPSHTKTETFDVTPSVTLTPPTTGGNGELTYTAEITVDGQTLTVKDVVRIAPAGDNGYQFSIAQRGWYEDSNKTLMFEVERTIGDELTFDLFRSVSVDGTVLDPSCYTAGRGSVVIHLKPEYLETLSLGTHTLLISFTDGYALTTFTVKAASGGVIPYYSGDESAAYMYVPPSNNPRTGDDSHLALWGVLACMSAVGVMLTARKRKRREQ